MRQTHVEWLEHLRPSGTIKGQAYCAHCAEQGMERIVGDADYHKARIADYDNIIAVLRNVNVGLHGDRDGRSRTPGLWLLRQ